MDADGVRRLTEHLVDEVERRSGLPVRDGWNIQIDPRTGSLWLG